MTPEHVLEQMYRWFPIIIIGGFFLRYAYTMIIDIFRDDEN